MSPLVEIEWVRRAAPLAPCGLWAAGSSATQIATRLLRSTDEERAALTGVASDDTVVIIGPGSALPWADGVRYLGRDPDAPGLLMTTTVAPALPSALVLRALRRAGHAGLIAVIQPETVVHLDDALPLDRAALEGWLARQESPR